MGASVVIPSCGTYEFEFPITYVATAPIPNSGYPIPSGTKISAPGGNQCVTFQVSAGWGAGSNTALIDQEMPVQGVTIEGITWDGSPSRDQVGFIWFHAAPNDQIVVRGNRFTGVHGTWPVKIGSDDAAFPVNPSPVPMPAGSLPATVYAFATIPTNIGEIDATTFVPDPSSATMPSPIPTGDSLFISPPAPLPSPSWAPYICTVFVLPANSCGYNVYAGASAATAVLQNATPIPIATSYSLTALVTPNPSASPGTPGSHWSGYGIPTTGSRLSANLWVGNMAGGGMGDVRALVTVAAWRDGVIDKNIFQDNLSCDNALEIYANNYHLTVSDNQFENNPCRGGDYSVDDSSFIQLVGNQHLVEAAPSPSPVGAYMPGRAINVQNSSSVAIDDTVQVADSAIGTNAMIVRDYAGFVDDHPTTANNTNSNNINVVPHWALGLNAGAGFLVPGHTAMNNTYMMHDIFLKGGWIAMNNSSA